MNHTSFRNLDFVKRTAIGRLCLSKPNGQPIYAYDNIEYDAMRSPTEVLEVVTTHLDASYLSSHYKRKHEFAGLCVVTTMTALYLLDDERFVPFSCKDQVGIRHWWFVDLISGIQPTAERYSTKTITN